MLVYAFAVLSLSFAQDQQAQQPTQPQQQPLSAEAQAAADEEARLNEVVCRREHVVGSNRPQRICQTRRVWEGMRATSLDRMDQGRTRSTEGGAGAVQSGAG